MDIIELMRACFSNCTVSNGMVLFNRKLNDEEYKAVHSKFSDDLLNCNIPHYRVVGFFHGWDDVHQHSMFRMNELYGCSLIELGFKMQDLIPTRNGGVNPEKGCFYGVNDEVQNLPDFNEGFGRSASMRSGTKRANALMLSKDEIGSMMCDTQGPPDVKDVPYLGSDTVWYTQLSYVYDADWPTMLIPNVKVCDIRRTGLKTPTVIMFIKKGTGRLDYCDTQKFFDESYDNIMPCRVSYDLSKYFTCAYVPASIGSLKLVYHTKINEEALTAILREYGKGIM